MRRIERLYRKLEKLGILDVAKKKDHVKIENPPYLPLVIKRLAPNKIILAHYYEQNGDLIPDPEMEILINHNIRVAVPMSFKNALIEKVWKAGKGKDSDKLGRELESFLEMWLKNIEAQKYPIKEQLKKRRKARINQTPDISMGR